MPLSQLNQLVKGTLTLYWNPHLTHKRHIICGHKWDTQYMALGLLHYLYRHQFVLSYSLYNHTRQIF